MPPIERQNICVTKSTAAVNVASILTTGANSQTVGGKFAVLAGEFSTGLYASTDKGETWLPAKPYTIWTLAVAQRKSRCIDPAKLPPQGRIWLKNRGDAGGEVVLVPFDSFEEADQWVQGQVGGNSNTGKGGDLPSRNYATVTTNNGGAVDSVNSPPFQPGCRAVLVKLRAGGPIYIADTPGRATAAGSTTVILDNVGDSFRWILTRGVSGAVGRMGYAQVANSQIEWIEDIYE